jgi:hypothetical protein
MPVITATRHVFAHQHRYIDPPSVRRGVETLA